MTERGRNIVIGLFVLLGLVVLGLLIVKFQAAVDYFGGRRDYYIEIQAEKTAAVLAGQTIHLNGYPIGTIKSVRLAEDPRDGVIITAAIGQAYNIPEDVDTVFIYQGQLGPPFIEINALPSHSPVPMEKTPGQVVATLKAQIPPDAFSQISQLAEQFSQTLDNLNSLIGDQQNRDNFRKSLANLSQAGADASEALKEFKAFAAQARKSTSQLSLDLRDAAQSVIGNSEQISELFRHLDQAARQINQGKGTAGKILYDPALYEELLSSSENLNEAVREFRTLLNKWSREGLKVKW
ncbi:MAG: hypothetical protein GWP14_06645 [Actinobacteria bacterium]|nr:hypothetical protein [Actinomycetota bacterium]